LLVKQNGPMKKTLITLILLVAFAFQGFTQKKYEENWASIKENYETPEWFKDAKLGIFIHWGVYSVPAYGFEWYGRNMYIDETANNGYHGKLGKVGASKEYLHHVQQYGHPSKFGYKDFIPMFKAEKFNAAE